MSLFVFPRSVAAVSIHPSEKMVKNVISVKDEEQQVNQCLEQQLFYKPADRGGESMCDREVRREGKRDEDQEWYPREIEQSPSQCTKRRVSTAAIRILFRICCIFFSLHHTASFFSSFHSLKHIKHSPTWTSFTSHRHLSMSLHTHLHQNYLQRYWC